MSNHLRLLNRDHAQLFIYAIFLIGCPLASVLVGYNLRIPEFENQGNGLSFPGRNIFLQVNLISVDALAGMMTLDWFVDHDSSCTRETASNASMCSLVNIYFDTNVLASVSSSDQGASNNKPKTPTFIYNGTSVFNDNSTANIAAWRTTFALLYPDQGSASLQEYPFDRYTAPIFIYAVDDETERRVGIAISRSRGTAVGYRVKAVQNHDLSDQFGVIENKIIITRGLLIKAYALIIVTAIWLITLIFVFVTIRSVLFGKAHSENVLVIPIASLFAFTQLRSAMPGAPEGFGAVIDFVGLLPCLALIVVSAFLTLGSLVLTNPSKDRPSLFNRICDRVTGTNEVCNEPSVARRQHDTSFEESKEDGGRHHASGTIDTRR